MDGTERQHRLRVLVLKEAVTRQPKSVTMLRPLKKNYQCLDLFLQTNGNGLFFCSSRRYGGNWSSVTPPSPPSCTSGTAPWAAVASEPKGKGAWLPGDSFKRLPDLQRACARVPATRRCLHTDFTAQRFQAVESHAETAAKWHCRFGTCDLRPWCTLGSDTR